MEEARNWPLELLIGLREDMAEMRATVRDLGERVGRLDEDVRRVDRRIDHLLLTQFATLAAVVGSIVATVVSAAIS